MVRGLFSIKLQKVSIVSLAFFLFSYAAYGFQAAPITDEQFERIVKHVGAELGRRSKRIVWTSLVQ